MIFSKSKSKALSQKTVESSLLVEALQVREETMSLLEEFKIV